MSLFFKRLAALPLLSEVEVSYRMLLQTDDGLANTDIGTIKNFFTASFESRLQALETGSGPPSQWGTPRTISLAGPFTGSVSLDGSQDVTLTVDVPTGALTFSAISGLAATLLDYDDRLSSVETEPAAGGGTLWTTVVADDVAEAVNHAGYLMDTGGVTREVVLPANAPAAFECSVKALGGLVRIVSNGNVIEAVGLGNNLLMDIDSAITLVAKEVGVFVFIVGNGAPGRPGTYTRSTAVVPHGAGSVALGKTSLLLNVAADAPTRIRFYCSAAAQLADAARAVTVSPPPGAGLLLECVLTPELLELALTPGALAFNLDSPSTNLVYYNIEPVSGDVAVTLTYLTLEN